MILLWAKKAISKRSALKGSGCVENVVGENLIQICPQTCAMYSIWHTYAIGCVKQNVCKSISDVNFILEQF